MAKLVTDATTVWFARFRSSERNPASNLLRYFLSDTSCPTRVFSFTPGVLAPGEMTEELTRQIDEKPVRYLLWSNRIFPEFGAPVFGKDFDVEVGDYLRSRYRRVGSLIPPAPRADWTASVWERKPEAEFK